MLKKLLLKWFLVAGSSRIFPLPSSIVGSAEILFNCPSMQFKESYLKMIFTDTYCFSMTRGEVGQKYSDNTDLKNIVKLFVAIPLPRLTSHCPVTPWHTSSG